MSLNILLVICLVSWFGWLIRLFVIDIALAGESVQRVSLSTRIPASYLHVLNSIRLTLSCMLDGS